MDKKEWDKKINLSIKKVRLARQIILSGFFTADGVTDICCKLGFHDTAFRDKTPEQKLNDYLLDENYWKKRPC